MITKKFEYFKGYDSIEFKKDFFDKNFEIFKKLNISFEDFKNFLKFFKLNQSILNFLDKNSEKYFKFVEKYSYNPQITLYDFLLMEYDGVVRVLPYNNSIDESSHLARIIGYKYFGYKDVQYYDKGTEGKVYTCDNGKKIIKVTYKRNISFRFIRLKNKMVKHLLKPYDVVYNSYWEKYIILMPKLDDIFSLKDSEVSTLIENFRTILNKINNNLDYIGKYRENDLYDLIFCDKKYLKSKINKFYEKYGSFQNYYRKIVYNSGSDEKVGGIKKLKPKKEIVDNSIKVEKKYFTQLVLMAREMKKFNIPYGDLSPNNCGVRNGNIVFFDYGYGKQEDERKIKKIKDLKIESYKVYNLK
jgi:hypothetical protein